MGGQGGGQETSREKTSFLKFTVTLPISRCSARGTLAATSKMSNFPLWAPGGTGWEVEIKKPEISTPRIYLVGLFKMKSMAFRLDHTLESPGAFTNSDTRTGPPAH